MVQGSYTEDITLLGFGIDVAIGLAGWDLPMDLRDLSADFTVNFEPTKLSWWATTAIDVLAVVPVIGAVKYVDDLGALGKNALKGMSKGVDKFKGAFKRAGNFLDGMTSGFRVALKNKDEALKSLKKTMEDGKKKLNEFLNGRFKSGSKTIKNVEAPILPEGSQWERNVLNSFAGGKSNSVTYEGGTTLYRVGGKNGGFWSLDPPPATEYQWRVDTAIKQEFCNDASTLYKMTIPEGATLSGLEGKVGSQGMGLYGGAHQVYIDYKAVPLDWIEIAPMQWK